jgi:hypothetical protein
MISAKQAIAELGGTHCYGCDGTKNKRMSHCRRCYFNLTRGMRARLYNLVGSGYEEAYEESVKILRARNHRPPRTYPAD